MVKIGRKNFEVEPKYYGRGKFVIETLSYEDPDYSQNNFKLYTSLQAIEDEKKLKELSIKISNHFRGYGYPVLTLEQAEKIIEILNL